MSTKLTEWRLKMAENVGSVLSKLNSAADATSSKIGGLARKLNSGKLTDFANEIPIASRSLDLLSSGSMLVGASIAATGALMYKSTDQALDYERAMAKINATAQLAPPELDKLKNDLVAIGEESGGNFMRIPDAFEKINSQVNNVSKSLDILEVANKGARAGFVDIDLAAGALAQTLSIVGKRDEASGVMDTLLKAKAVGAGEFSDFATYLPQLIASGDNLNIPYKDVAGLFAFMTAKGQSASDSGMLLQNAFTAMGKSDIQQGFEKKGISLFDKEGNMRDLSVFFGELQKKLGKFNAESKSNWLESVGLKDAQAKNAFSVLAGDAEKLKNIMGDVRDSTGELNRQLDMTANKAATWSDIGDKIKSGMLALGDFLLPIVDKMIKGAESLYNYYSGNTKNWAGYDIMKLQKDDQLAKQFALNKVKEKFPTMGPAVIEKLGMQVPTDPKQKEKYDKLVPKEVRETYDYNYKWDMAKLTGNMFGGDYDKFMKDEKDRMNNERLAKEAGKDKETFHIDKKKKKNLKDGIDNINQGGQRIINVQFGKLNENIIIQPQTLKEGTTEIVLDLEEMLVRAIEGTENSISNE